MAEQYTQVFDKQTNQLMEAPISAAKVLAGQGYVVGPEAALEARIQGPEGKIAAFGASALSGLTFGLSDAIMPKSLLQIEHQVRTAHPGYSVGGEILGQAPRNALLGPAGRVISQGIEGGLEAAAAQRRRNEPIFSEALAQGLGWGALTGLIGEGVGAVVKGALPAAHKALVVLGKRAVPYTAETLAGPTETLAVRSGEGAAFEPGAATLAGEGGPTTEAHLLPNIMQQSTEDAARQGKLTRLLSASKTPAEQSGTVTATALPGAPVEGPRTYGPLVSESNVDKATLLVGLGKQLGVPGLVGTKALLTGGNRLPAAYMNNADAIGATLDKIAAGPLQKISATVKTLINGGQATYTATRPDQVDAIANHLENVNVSPEAVQAFIDRTYGHAFAAAPDAFAGAAARTHALSAKLAAALPQSNAAPTILPAQRPMTTSARIKFAGIFDAGTDITKMLASPTPEAVALHDELHPELMRYTRALIMGELEKDRKTPLSLRQTRQLSTIMGAPLRPENTPAFLATMQMLASTPPPAPAKHPPTPSAAGAAKAVNRDMPAEPIGLE